MDVMASAIWKCLTLGHLIPELFALGVLNSSFYLFVLLNFEHSSVIKKQKIKNRRLKLEVVSLELNGVPMAIVGTLRIYGSFGDIMNTNGWHPYSLSFVITMGDT